MSKDYKNNVLLEYNKEDVVLLASIRGSVHTDKRNAHKWLNNIIEFLNSPRAQNVLEWQKTGDQGDYFLNREMNINHGSNPQRVKDYKFNLITAITLSILLIYYEEDYFKALLKNEFVSEEESEIWFDKVEKKIEDFQDYWNEKLDQGVLVELNGKLQKEKRSWGIISINILSQFYKLTLLKINQAHIGKLDKELQEFTDKFLSLGNKSKNKAFSKIESRLKYMDKQLDDVIEDMEYIERLEFDVNLQLKKGNDIVKGSN